MEVLPQVGPNGFEHLAHSNYSCLLRDNPLGASAPLFGGGPGAAPETVDLLSPEHVVP